jgi:HEAT repeat protein
MRLRYRIGFVGLLVVVASALLWAGRSREPSYQGKRLSQWMDVLAHSSDAPDNPPRKQATKAIRHIGTNALPFLLAEMKYKESPFDKALFWLNQKQAFKEFTVVTEHEHVDRAQWAFRALGPAAKPAIPALTAMLNGPSAWGYEVAPLAAIGPASLPTFTNALTNQNPLIRMRALSGLGEMEGQAETSVPAIVGFLKDPDKGVQLCAVSALAHIHKNGGLAVPALISSLEGEGWSIRWVVAFALAAYGPEAKPAVPALLKLCNDPDEDTRSEATNALKKIDPEAATKAGIR